MANNHCFILGTVRSLFLWLLLHVLLISASPTAPVLDKRIEVKFRTSAQTYEYSVANGQYFNKLFPLDDERATEVNSGIAVASPFKVSSALKPNGWSRYIYWFPYKKNTGDDQPLLKIPNPAVNRLKLEIIKEPEYGRDLDNAFADKDHPVDQTQAGVYTYRHDRRFGKHKKPTMASYSNVIVPASGAIVFMDDFSPRARQEQWKIGDVPELTRLSDLVFFQWIDACKAKLVDPKSLKLLFISHVVHDTTYKVVVDALREAEHTRMPPYSDKVVFSMDTREGQAILGSVWGSALSWMLLQHKRELGLKRITEVAVWGLRSGFALPTDNTLVGTLNMRFTVDDA